MPEGNIEIIRSVYDLLNRGDWDEAFRFAAPDFEVTLPPQAPNAGAYAGVDVARGVIRELLEPFEVWNVKPEQFVDTGDRVAVIVETHAQPKGASAGIANRNGHLWTFQRGKIKSLRFFPNPEDAFEAAGLEE